MSIALDLEGRPLEAESPVWKIPFARCESAPLDFIPIFCQAPNHASRHIICGANDAARVENDHPFGIEIKLDAVGNDAVIRGLKNNVPSGDAVARRCLYLDMVRPDSFAQILNVCRAAADNSLSLPIFSYLIGRDGDGGFGFS